MLCLTPRSDKPLSHPLPTPLPPAVPPTLPPEDTPSPKTAECINLNQLMGLAIRTSRQSFAECVIIPSRLATSENPSEGFPKRPAGNAHGDPPPDTYYRAFLQIGIGLPLR